MTTARGILWTVADVATHLGVPESAVRDAAAQHGFLIRFGRAVRIKPEDLEALIEQCRSAPVKLALPSGNGQDATPSTSSATFQKAVAASKSARALQTAQRLKQPSRPTSQAKPADVVLLRQQT